jgi:xanthine dehydrogenase/oxidase
MLFYRHNYFSSWGAGLVTAEVDCLTGDVVVLTVDLVIDVGKSLNPAIDIGQIEGGFVHGMGYATNEQIIVDPVTGKTLTNGPGTYKVPTASDIPKEFNVSLLRHTNGRPTSAIYSSKGMGEAATILGCSGVLLSVKDAVAAYRRDQGNGEWFQLDVPATKDKIRMAARDDIVAFVENNVGKVRLEERDGFEI